MRILVVLLCITLSQLSMAASFKLPDNTEVVLVNGNASPPQSSVTLDLTMPEAIQQIAFRYHARFRANGSQNSFTSDVILLSFQASEQAYQLTLPSINSAASARQFNAQPKLTLTDQTGKTVVFSQDKLMKSGLQIGRDWVQEITQYNASNKIAAISLSPNKRADRINKPTMAADKLNQAPSSNSTISTANSTTINTVISTTSVNAMITADKSENVSQAEVSKMLDYWYQQANVHTQAEFKAKINQ